VSEPLDGQRIALLVATDRYQDASLSRLIAPSSDVRNLAAVLGDRDIAGFRVTRLYNKRNHVIGKAIGDFYRQRRRDDLTLLYFTGHGLKDADGQLYLAMTDTERDNLQFTGLLCEHIRAAMEGCLSRQNVLILDCCYAGAFPAGRGVKGDDVAVHTMEKLGGRGRVVLTSSDATQYSFDGTQLTETGPPSLRAGRNSLFTRFLIEGIKTGRADLDGDGDIALDELYKYVHDRVTAEQPLQRPKIKEDVEGRILIAQNIHWRLPQYINDAVGSPYAPAKLTALDDLRRLLSKGSNIVKQRVLETVRELADDDSKQVSAAAYRFLAAVIEEKERPEAEEQARRLPAGPGVPPEPHSDPKPMVALTDAEHTPIPVPASAPTVPASAKLPAPELGTAEPLAPGPAQAPAAPPMPASAKPPPSAAAAADGAGQPAPAPARQPAPPQAPAGPSSLVRTLIGHGGPVNGVAFSPDGKLLATAGADGTARLWEVATGERVRVLTGHGKLVQEVAFSPDGKLLATAGADGTARLWEVATGEQVRVLTGRPMWGVAFSPDGRLLATAEGGSISAGVAAAPVSENSVRLWEVATGEQVRVLTGHGKLVQEVAFSPDGKLLATAGADKTARLWEVATGERVRVLTGHGAPVNGMAFSPDGKLLATAGADGKTRLWE
jgi:hypothetical protein